MARAIKTRPHLLCVNNGTPESADRVQSFLDAYYAAATV